MDQTAFKRILAKALGIDEQQSKGLLERLAGGFCDVFGNVSYLTLQRNVGLNLVAATDMEYSKSLLTPVKESTAKKLEFAFLRFSPSTQSKQKSSSIRKGSAAAGLCCPVGEEKPEREGKTEEDANLMASPEAGNTQADNNGREESEGK